MDLSFCISINSSTEFEQKSITLPSGWAENFPAIASLLYLYAIIPDCQLDQLRYQSDLNLDAIWEPLLNNTRDLSPYDFPPEILASMGSTLEIQAALMLIHACTAKKISLTINVPASATQRNSRLLKIINHSKTGEASAFEKTPAQLLGLLTLRTHDKAPMQPPSFKKLEDLRSFSSINRHMLAYWVEDAAYLNAPDIEHDSEESNVLQMLANYAMHQERSFSAKVKSPLARYYIFTATSASDEVVIDKLFLRSYENTKQEAWAEMVNLYAHIKCALVYPTEKLDLVIKQCADKKLAYWLAYFLSYGQVVHNYNNTYNRTIHSSRLTQAFHIYRKMGDWVGATRALHSKSTLLSKELNFRNARKYLEICLAIRLFLQDTLGIARVLNGISYVNSQLEDFQTAIHYAEKAIGYLSTDDQFEELSFTYTQISWYYFLLEQYPKAVEFGCKTIAMMNAKNVRTLPFRTKPDIHAQLGLSYFYNDDIDNALLHSDYCESHKVDSTATGEIERIILRALINDYRQDYYLSEISYSYIPELLKKNPEIDPYLELIFYRIMVARYQREKDDWKERKYKEKGLLLCRKLKFKKAENWFK